MTMHPHPESLFIAVDWSGAREPANKIWLAAADSSGLRVLEPHESREAVVERVIKLADKHRETIVGLDSSFSLPQWFVREQGAAHAFEFWSVVERHGEAWLNRCESPFWGRKGTRRPYGTDLFRRTESRLEAVNGIKAKSCFQLNGPGTVGTGTLRGIPFLARLRSAGFSVWPFDAPKLPMVVEIYPRLLTGPVNKSDVSERAAYLRCNCAGLAKRYVRAATDSEDAFDAAVSALVMARNGGTFAKLSSTFDDECVSLEGEIWQARARGQFWLS